MPVDRICIRKLLPLFNARQQHHHAIDRHDSGKHARKQYLGPSRDGELHTCKCRDPQEQNEYTYVTIFRVHGRVQTHASKPENQHRPTFSGTPDTYRRLLIQQVEREKTSEKGQLEKNRN